VTYFWYGVKHSRLAIQDTEAAAPLCSRLE